jgi:hypothetical protein
MVKSGFLAGIVLLTSILGASSALAFVEPGGDNPDVLDGAWFASTSFPIGSGTVHGQTRCDFVAYGETGGLTVGGYLQMSQTGALGATGITFNMWEPDSIKRSLKKTQLKQGGNLGIYFSWSRRTGMGALTYVTGRSTVATSCSATYSMDAPPAATPTQAARGWNVKCKDLMGDLGLPPAVEAEVLAHFAGVKTDHESPPSKFAFKKVDLFIPE